MIITYSYNTGTVFNTLGNNIESAVILYCVLFSCLRNNDSVKKYALVKITLG